MDVEIIAKDFGVKIVDLKVKVGGCEFQAKIETLKKINRDMKVKTTMEFGIGFLEVIFQFKLVAPNFVVSF